MAGNWENYEIFRDNIIGKETEIHCIPVNDLRPHDLASNCWCHPKDLGEGVFSHNSLDGRESYENGRKLQ